MQSEKMLLIMGEISRNDVGIPPEVKLFFDDEKWNRRNDGLFLRKSTLILITKNRRDVGGNLSKLLGIPPEFKPILIMKNKTEQETVEEMLRQISRLSPQSINHIGVYCLDLLRNRLELSLKEPNKMD